MGRRAARVCSKLLEVWTRSGTDNTATEVQPPPRTRPHPPLLLATASDAGVEFAARNGFALQHYFATPAVPRVQLERRYRELRGERGSTPGHLHTLIVVVDGTPGRRDQLADALRRSFHEGDHRLVPQAPNRHVGRDGKPMDPDTMAKYVAEQAIVGSPSQVVDELGGFIETTGARRIALFHEAIGDASMALKSLQDFALLVAPQLTH
jgi:alkanesulfonate monooxygenase SsuD/methylene tetrahydromethanopterin reductase-like flavin-dependent oxidoreductase (luciferase family)